MKKSYVFTIGNIKGGAGKTTVCMHLITMLMKQGIKVASIDTDCYQHSLTSYIKNREKYNEKNKAKLLLPIHFLIEINNKIKQEEEKIIFEDTLAKAKDLAQIVIIDTPGNFCNISSIAHSYADTIITPINDSFLDLNLLVETDPSSLKINKMSIYTQMVWQQKLQRAQRNKEEINWIILRNRLSTLNAKNKKALSKVINKFAKKIGCKIAPGFTERVIYKELFLTGMTLIDLDSKKSSFSLSHIAARQEMRSFLNFLKIKNFVT